MAKKEVVCDEKSVLDKIDQILKYTHDLNSELEELAKMLRNSANKKIEISEKNLQQISYLRSQLFFLIQDTKRCKTVVPKETRTKKIAFKTMDWNHMPD